MVKENKKGDKILYVNLTALKKLTNKAVAFFTVGGIIFGAGSGVIHVVKTSYEQEQAINNTNMEMYDEYLNGEIDLDQEALANGLYVEAEKDDQTTNTRTR